MRTGKQVRRDLVKNEEALARAEARKREIALEAFHLDDYLAWLDEGLAQDSAEVYGALGEMLVGTPERAHLRPADWKPRLAIGPDFSPSKVISALSYRLSPASPDNGLARILATLAGPAMVAKIKEMLPEMVARDKSLVSRPSAEQEAELAQLDREVERLQGEQARLVEEWAELNGPGVPLPVGRHLAVEA